MPAIDKRARDLAGALLRYIDASPSPCHAVAAACDRLRQHGFQTLRETEAWRLAPGDRCCVVRDGASLIAFSVGERALPETGWRIVSAHTDSPGLRLKPRPLHSAGHLLRLGVEVYGSPILATFADRDLSLAGRITVAGEAGRIETRLVRIGRPLLRLPNLAIHMNRAVNEEGLKFHKQDELPLLLASAHDEDHPQDLLMRILAAEAGCAPEQILTFDLAVYDTQPAAFWGPREEFIAAARLDNLASCHAGLEALLESQSAGSHAVCALFDHEEIGSESMKGAAGSFLGDTLTRIADAMGHGPSELRRALAHSALVSADMAHAYQPNFPRAYEPEHTLEVNYGPAIKRNAQMRYASESVAEALFIRCCLETGVPFQHYVHRSDIPCGSTVGPILSAGLGLRTVDVGNPLWAMHSIRESAGVLDHGYLVRVLTRFYGCEDGQG